MDHTQIGQIIGLVVGIILIILIVSIFRKPIKWLIKLLISSALGLVALLLVNLGLGAFGITIGINLYTVLTAGILGLPGIVLLLILKVLFGV